ncbi:hypothetical protein QBC36DRAFT_350072 [Triangularia setosa]|uniref:Uncharacterized protein n=1 Tax=Triangularia setosa TaxID=2587417 RepID=A0AAN7A476_9PEZI|nr:hypothetical protein QBC36DRAFT_350072 [Podospora setosa]
MVTVREKRLDVPTVDNFGRRWNLVTAVLGDYVYIDGGEITQFEDGSPRSRIYLTSSCAVNSTLSIDLSISWSTSDASFRTVQKFNIPRNKPMIWIDKADKGGFYIWSRAFYLGRGLTDCEMWKFSADSQGGGSRSLDFSIGGYASPLTQPGFTNIWHQIIPRIVVFDMWTKEISNRTATDEGLKRSPFDTLIGGKAHFNPRFIGTETDRGLILVLDGTIPMESSPGFDLKNPTLFDSDTREKYRQAATGNILPYPRSHFCITGFTVAGDGYDVTRMPTFSVFPALCEPRSDSSSRISVHPVGISAIFQFPNRFKSLNSSAHVHFDMATLAWKDIYGPNAKDYERAKAFMNWYQNG